MQDYIRTEEVSWEQGRVESACPTAKPTLRVDYQERERGREREKIILF